MMQSCKVCFENRKKLNKHGSCRCCRVFFYRATRVDQLYKTLKCLENPIYCDKVGLGKMSCKKCRFERCLKANMTIPSNDTGNTHLGKKPLCIQKNSKMGICEKQGYINVNFVLIQFQKRKLQKKGYTNVNFVKNDVSEM